MNERLGPRALVRLLGLGALLALAPGCGTRVIELPGAPEDAGADAPQIQCKTEKGPLETCTRCYFSNGAFAGMDCEPVVLPPCAANMGPSEGQCTRCQVFLLPNQGKTNSCLACKDWDRTMPATVCRTCVWQNIPYEVSCQQCMDLKGQLVDQCDEILKKLQTAI